MRKTALKTIILLAFAASATGCALKLPKSKPAPDAQTSEASVKAKKPARQRSQLFGKSNKTNEQPGIGVNSYLWRATLDTLNFMPVLSADPFGGTYVTDWHASPQNPAERFKIQVFILDTRLRADGIAVRVFRQTGGGSSWTDAAVDPDTSLQIENAILTRARQLRIATLESSK